MSDLGWHVISGEDFLSALRRCESGEPADVVFAELWANAEHELERENARDGCSPWCGIEGKRCLQTEACRRA